jgi:uncharacterized protein (DUF1697 family)
MKTYIALLRGINVSGQKKIRMADLKEHLEELGWHGIRTYIQSGNIIFQSKDENPGQMASAIRDKLKDKYGFEVPTLVMVPEELKHIIQSNPFMRDPGAAGNRLYVTFLFSPPGIDLASELQVHNKPNEQFVLKDKVVFLYYPDGYGRAMMNNNAFEKVLKVEATTRNWNTVNKLYEMTQP